MNLLVTTQENLQLPDFNSVVWLTIIALVVGIGLGGWLLSTGNVLLKFLGLIFMVGAVVFALSQWNTTAALRLTIGIVIVLVVSVGQLMQGGAKTRGQKAVFILTGVLAVLALFVVLPGALTQPLGTVGDIFVVGWNTILEMANIADDGVPGV